MPTFKNCLFLKAYLRKHLRKKDLLLWLAVMSSSLSIISTESQQIAAEIAAPPVTLTNCSTN
jgi:hypothetical protein